MREVARELSRVGSPATSITSPASSPTPDVTTPSALFQGVPAQSGGRGVRPASSPLGGGLPWTFENALGMRFVLVQPGTFLMGSPPDEADRYDDERQHEVTLTKPFYLSVHQVTQGQWKTVMGSNPSDFSRAGVCEAWLKDVCDAELDRFPVESVSWDEARWFLKKLAVLTDETSHGREYRLPSEAQWEYACRGGHLIRAILGDKHTLAIHLDQPASSLSSTQANFEGNVPYGGAVKGPNLERPSKVGSYRPNRLGLCDMHGNVWEWCSDWSGEYPSGAAIDPLGPPHGTYRVCRGGGWRSYGRYCRAANRDGGEPWHRNCDLGFRVAAVLSE
jgi:formylglycine-generating enzyme required for sulfatase activity